MILNPWLPKVLLREKPQQTKLWVGGPVSLICLSLHPQINSQGFRAGKQMASLRRFVVVQYACIQIVIRAKAVLFLSFFLFKKLIYFDGRIVFFTVL